MLEIILDTETTGLNVASGDRLIEIGCIELKNRVKSGRHFHQYLNPDCEISKEAFAVHGLSKEFLSDKPKFKDIAPSLLQFLGEAKIVIHNAKFDLGFLNYELKMSKLPEISNQIIDSLLLAKQKFPGSPASLDALCKKLNIDLSKRTKHGALLDAELLTQIYLELTGGSQISLSFENETRSEFEIEKIIFPRRYYDLSTSENEQHLSFIKAQIPDSLWLKD